MTITLGWPHLTNTRLIMSTVTNATWITNAGRVELRGTFTNVFADFKPVSNYTIWLGTNKLITTNGTSARVSYARGTAPTFDLRANLTDGQSLEFGSFTFPQPVGSSALLAVNVETATNPSGPWQFSTKLTKVLGADEFKNAVGFYRCSLEINPLGSNSVALAFSRNALLITNTP